MKFTKLSTILLSLGLSVCLTTGCSEEEVDNERTEEPTQEETLAEEEVPIAEREDLSEEFKLGYESGVNIVDAEAYNDTDEILYHIEFDHVNAKNPDEFKYPSYITGMCTAFFDKGIEYKDDKGNIVEAEDLVVALVELYEDELDKNQRNREKIEQNLKDIEQKLEEGPIE